MRSFFREKKIEDMGITASRENGSQAVVRIKRAGGYLEEIRRPVTAQELMLHNPKHWVTKPGVFRALNPVVEVVPPEFVLTPGHTFLLLPFTTMQSLLKRQRMCPTSLDHLMDRPGLALPDWYHQQRCKMISKVCPLKNCKCVCAKDGRPKRSVTFLTANLTDLRSESKACSNVDKMNKNAESRLLCSNTSREDALDQLVKKGIDVTFLTSKKDNTLRAGVDSSSKNTLHRSSNVGIDAMLSSCGKGKDGNNQHEEKKRFCTKSFFNATGLRQRGRGCKKQGTYGWTSTSCLSQ
ncbi:hypothetical protein L7F22_017313 [Adiantum nelumboides]|nr:hypothetical protein [Adiantum nelumboides]